jgi:hypothetical protein
MSVGPSDRAVYGPSTRLFVLVMFLFYAFWASSRSPNTAGLSAPAVVANLDRLIVSSSRIQQSTFCFWFEMFLFLLWVTGMYVKKKNWFRVPESRFEKSSELLTASYTEFERLMCEVEFWEVLVESTKVF